jgi:hypothetical protein
MQSLDRDRVEHWISDCYWCYLILEKVMASDRPSHLAKEFFKFLYKGFA